MIDLRSICSSLERDDASLTLLNLNFAGIGNAGVRQLASALLNNSHLLVLFLNGNEISDTGAKLLAQSLRTHPKLQQVYLAYNSIGNGGATALAQAVQYSKIQLLKLSHNEIGSEGCIAIAQALSQNPILTRLLLDANKIDVDGAQAIAQGLLTNTMLKSVDLRHNLCEKEVGLVINAFRDALQTNGTLHQVFPSDFAVDWFLQLNKLGRHSWGSSSIDARAWIRVLCACRDRNVLMAVCRARPDLLEKQE